MIKIAHFGDVHIHNLKRHNEYKIQFEKIYIELKKHNPDKIIIAGDLFEEFVAISNEAKDLGGDFLDNLSKIAKVIIVPGNHDIMKKNKNRLNSVEVLINLLKNKNIKYISKSGFYNDDDFENVVWVNYSHLEKNIDPWNDIQYTKDNNKIYIGLFHDPIYESSTDTGKKFNSSKNKPLSYFKNNDFVLLADIHKRQFFRDNNSAAYVGSTIQQSFGESPYKHGFLIWDIVDKNNFKIEEVDIKNDYNYINFKIDEKTNYDNLNFEHELLNPLSNVKIKWNDISSNINFENEIKIRNYFKHTYNINSIKIEKNAIYTDVSGVKMINESVDVLNPITQRDIFIEYLQSNGYKDVFIEEILKIDDIINSRINISINKGITWGIDKIFFNNFKSYGDDIVIDFNKMDTNSIIQINGINQQGKTTILDAISYVLYGKTTTTTKREKNGDNRYINNKRDLNYCNGGAVITINDDVYTIIRETERKWNKTNTDITSCSTNVDYYVGTDIIEENKLTGEQKTNTQKLIDDSIGDFDDFIRLVLTNADNLNSLLSLDRSVFIDSITKDAGYDIFEKKLEEFKKYRSEINKNRINIDIKTHENSINEIKDIIKNNDNEIDIIDKKIDDTNTDKPLLIKTKENTIELLEKVDDSLYNLNIEDIEDNIKKEKDKIDKRKSQLEKIEELKIEIKDYDTNELKNKKDKLSEIKDIISDKKSKIKDYDIDITKLNSEINTINSKIKDIINDYIGDLNIKINVNDKELSSLKESFNTKIVELKNTLKDELNNLQIIVNNNNNDLNNFMEQGKTLKIDTDVLTNSLDHKCITCHRQMDDESRIIVNQKITDNKNKMIELKNKINDIKPIINETTLKINKINDKLKNISDKDYSFDDDLYNMYNNTVSKISDLKKSNTEIDKTLSLIKENIYPLDLKIKISLFDDDKSDIILKLTNLEDEKIKLNKELEIKNDELDVLNEEIEKLEDENEKYIKKKESIQLEDKINLDIEKSKNIINNYNIQIEKYNKEIDKIEKNKKLKTQISEITDKIDEIESTINELKNNKIELEKENYAKNIEIQKFKNDIKTFEKQKKQDEILDSYMKCVHRDGLPSFLLKKSIHIINQELNNILSDVDFTLFFDDNLNLKLSHDIRMDISQNAIESSGMERTFCAIALKIALRKINNKSKPNIILLDELFGKLVERSVELLTSLVDSIKNEVDKLIIIEHVNPLNYDYLIEVNKDENGISDLKIEY